MTSETASDDEVLSEAALRTVFHSVNDAIFVHDAETGEIIDVNKAMCDMYGYSREEARQLSIGDLSSGVEPYTQAEADSNLQRVTSTESHISEWHAEASDGSRFWVEISMSRASVDGEPRILVIVRDITERKKQQQELETLRTRLDLTLKETGTGIWEWNITTDEVVWDNTSEQLFGYDSGEFSGRFEDLAERISDEDRHSVETAAQRAIETNSEYQAEFRVALPDGERRWIQARGVIEYDETGEPERLIGVQRDITDRVTQTRHIKTQRDNLELLNSVVRHDIRNDLQLVDAYGEMLNDRVDEQSKAYLSMIRKGTTNALDLTEMARELADVMLHPERKNRSVPLQSVLTCQIKSVSSSYPDAEISVEEPLTTTNVVADELLDAVFRNLLKNAVQHNDSATPEVSVSIDLRGQHVEIRIADNGPGVAETRKDVIFGKGEQGLESDGTGIGLFLVQSLVDGYGGEVWVEDNTPTGAVFVVRLAVDE